MVLRTTEFRRNVLVVMIVLGLLLCVVPATVGGLVIRAMDVLLSEDIPRVLQSGAVVAASSMRRNLLSSSQDCAQWTSTLLKPIMPLVEERLGENETWQSALQSALEGRDKPLLTLWERCVPQQCFPSLQNDPLTLSDCRIPAVMLSYSVTIDATSWRLQPAVLLCRSVSATTGIPFIEVWMVPEDRNFGTAIVNQSNAGLTVTGTPSSLVWMHAEAAEARFLSPLYQFASNYVFQLPSSLLLVDLMVPFSASTSSSSSSRIITAQNATYPTFVQQLWNTVLEQSTVTVAVPSLPVGAMGRALSAVALIDRTAPHWLLTCATDSRDVMQRPVPIGRALDARDPSLCEVLARAAVSRIVGNYSSFFTSTQNDYYVISSPLSYGSPLTVLVAIPTADADSQALRTRGQLAVVAVAAAVVPILLLVVTFRSLVNPVPQLTEAVQSCATLQLHRLGIMEASFIEEIADIQRSVSYLAVRLFHYLKFLPDREVVQRLLEEDPDDPDGSDAQEGEEQAVGQTLRPHHSSESDSGSAEDESEGPDRGGRTLNDQSVAARLEAAKQRKEKRLSSGQMHQIDVQVVYEGKRDVSSLSSQQSVLRSVQFQFEYSSMEQSILSRLMEKCRVKLNELPGEVLVLFTSWSADDPQQQHQSKTIEGTPVETLRPTDAAVDTRQLMNDEDFLLAIENAKLSSMRHQRAATGREANSSPQRATKAASAALGSSSPRSRVELRPVLYLQARKANNRKIIPLLIATQTLVAAIARLVLSAQRLSEPTRNVQLLGLLIIGCLGIQIAQNTLISLYLVRRFSVLSREFRRWRRQSSRDVVLGVLLGSLNVTNLECMGCHVKLGSMRLAAPITQSMHVKISKYSLVGFIVGDLLPFVFITINTILFEEYRNPFVLVSTLASVISVASIMITHGLLRFVVSESAVGGAADFSSPTSGGSSEGIVVRGSSKLSSSRGAPTLTRKEVTVIKLSISHQDALTEYLPAVLLTQLITSFYECIERAARSTGGLVMDAYGLSVSVVYNAHTVVPDHAHVGLTFFRKARHEVEQIVLPRFFSSEKLRAFVSNTMPNGTRGQALAVQSVIQRLHGSHRVVGSMMTDEMVMGFMRTLTAQTFQHVGYHTSLLRALCSLAEFYDATLLTTSGTIERLQQATATSHPAGGGGGGGGGGGSVPATDSSSSSYGLLFRDVDRIVLSKEMISSTSVSSASSSPKKQPPRHTKSHFQDPDTDADRLELQTKFGVREIVLHGFTPREWWGCSWRPDVPPPPTAASPSPLSSSSSQVSIHRLRRRPLTSDVESAIHQFQEAFRILEELQNDGPMRMYLVQHPNDVVAHRVVQWASAWTASMTPCSAATDAGPPLVRYPRVLTVLGLSRHRCELRPTEPGAVTAATSQPHSSASLGGSSPRSAFAVPPPEVPESFLSSEHEVGNNSLYSPSQFSRSKQERRAKRAAYLAAVRGDAVRHEVTQEEFFNQYLHKEKFTLEFR